MPAFDPEGGLLLVAARALGVAAVLSAFGTLAFRIVVAPRAFRRAPDVAVRVHARLLLVTQGSLAAGLAGLLAWLVLQAADMAGPMPWHRALPAVLGGTSFGHLVLAQAGLLALAMLAAGRRDATTRQWGALILAGAAVALQAGHGHSASMTGRPAWLLPSAVLHLLAAGAWLGGLLPLLLVVRMAPAKAAASAARWFSPLGKACLVAMTVTSVAQGWLLVGSVAGLAGTAYGWMALCKLALFGTLFGFAVLNRYWLAPALLHPDPAPPRRTLMRSIAVQTAFGLAVVAAAALLSSLPPAMHEQPLWPFPERFTLDTVAQDPDFLHEVLQAALELAVAAALLAAAIVLRRRLRWTAALAAVAIAGFAVPHFDLLFVPAYPTSFYQSPTGFAAASVTHGQSLYPVHCAACHGAEGHGDGPAAAGLPVPPADLTAEHLWMHADGELFWWLAHGMAAPDGGLAMPGFADTLSDTDRWDLIDYLHAHNAGLVARRDGTWSPPLQAPGLQAECDGGATRQLGDMRGQVVRLVLGSGPVASNPGVTTVLATGDPAVQPAPGRCVTRDPAVPAAYGLVTGLAPAGVQVLIDAAGWLRAMQAPGARPGWDDPATLAAAIRQIHDQPLAASDGHMAM